MTTLTTYHKTEYRYGEPVLLGPHRMMLRPREARDLRLVSHEITLTPDPDGDITWAHDVAGNAVATAHFNQLSNHLIIESRSTVVLTAAIWPVFAIAAEAISFPFHYSGDDWADLGALTTPQYPDPEARFSRWVESFVLQRPTDTLSLLKDIANGVSTQISYQNREMEGTQSPLETLTRGWGSCRDFALLFAEAARTLSLGARIVSGYLFDPKTNLTGSEGSGSTHAWAEVFIPGAGWVAFDPTNRSVGAKNLIPIAVARGIHQVVPVAGSFSGSGNVLRSMTVEVRHAVVEY
ncbi:transglutaminase family protein [Limimaricola pyoseonensis]|uniref:Transglutaminase-like enzyme, putative cysteine protease n=1 Tax=Limimaricola pyoseonensis TaxID=521013 RepID=A0A1G7GT21_9RHOB|nr:transglutaminase family protein [Limimaricola pyoseonensis]SDE91266.1 Transglutaminase-like enzyme, putative cysteine protease [Limimaricola pyoseonensis]